MEQLTDYMKEDLNLRMSWNILPKDKIDKERFISPIGFHYTPLKQVSNLQILDYEPLLCANCSSVLNPYCNVDFRSKYWECPFCLKKNLFPPNYAQNISETTLPPEMIAEYNTVEYNLEKKGLSNHPVVFFAIDIAIEEDELMQLKEKIQVVIDNLPDDAGIGLLTFGTMVNLLEVGFTDFPKLHVFKGDKSYSAQEIQEALGFISKNDPRKDNKSSSKRFILPKKDCAFSVSSFLDELSIDLFPKKEYHRRQNCGGLALNTAITLLETVCNGEPCRIEFFLGGAPNIGDGKIVSTELKETIRNFVDFQKNNDNTKYFKSASEYYNNLAVRAMKASQIIDLYNCSFNQTGLLEMKSCAEKTGGMIVCSDSFSHSCFKESFIKLFELNEEGKYKMGFKGKLEIFITKPYTILGGIGYMTSVDLKQQKPLDMVSKDSFAQGNTRVWNLGGINSNSTYSIQLDVAEGTNSISKRAISQIITYYVAGDLTHKMRVTTFMRKVAGDFNSSLLEVAQSFDQEATAVMLAKHCVELGYKQENIDTLRWLDKTIIRLVTKFSEYKIGDIQSFKLNNRFNMFPQFMFYLRRSPFISDFNSSLDESVFYKSTLINETMINSTVMIQPILYSYTAEVPEATPVHLDIENMKDEVVLYMDAFFFICIWHGATVCSWVEKGLQDDPEYENIKNMIELPQEAAQELIQERLPVPKLISCDSGNGQERYLKSVLNPSCNNYEQNSLIPNGYYTDDVSLKRFWEHLKKKVVQS